jgi:predicted sulfurtransferase
MSCAAPPAAAAPPAPPPPAPAPEQQGVLIFFKYAPLAGAAGDEVEATLRSLCEALALRGRVRVADDGVNAALGGALPALRQLCEAVAALPALAAEAPGARPIDFQARA